FYFSLFYAEEGQASRPRSGWEGEDIDKRDGGRSGGVPPPPPPPFLSSRSGGGGKRQKPPRHIYPAHPPNKKGVVFTTPFALLTVANYFALPWFATAAAFAAISSALPR
ncbi:hypothetical protein BS412_08835, partial [Cronobacter turicensis]